MKRVTWFTVVAAAVAATAGVTSALGQASLTSIGALTPAAGGTPESRVHALSPDGNWVVGISNGPDEFGIDTISQPVVWSAGSGLVQLPNTSSLAATANGVVVLGNGDLGIAGFLFDSVTASPRMQHYVVSPGNLTGGTWAVSPGSNQGNTYIGPYNAARTYDDGTGQHWSIAGQRGTTGRGAGSFPSLGVYCDYLTSGFQTKMNVMTRRADIGTNRTNAAGFDNGNAGLRRAVYGNASNGSPQTPIPGGAGYESEALGMTPEAGPETGSGVIVGYDRDTTDDHFEHAFSWTIDLSGDVPPVGLGSMTYLGELPGDVASAAIDARLIGGNLITAGWSSDGTTEKAVVWDSTGTWDSSGQAKLVSSLLSGAGVDVSEWTQLSRVTSMSDDGMTFAGWGVWAADGTTRGFVATIPEPATLGLLGLGAWVLLRRRR